MSKTNTHYVHRELFDLPMTAEHILELTLDQYLLCCDLGCSFSFGGTNWYPTKRGWRVCKFFRMLADDFTCQCCKSEAVRCVLFRVDGVIHTRLVLDNGMWLTVDHIHRRRDGGANCFDNLQTLCYRCNLARESVNVRFIP